MTYQFYCLKLKTGETLFSEVLSIDKYIELRDPFLILQENDNGRMVTAAFPWVPYCETEMFTINMDMFYMMKPLSRRFIEFYASVLLQYKVSEVKSWVESQLCDETSDYMIMMDGLEKIKQINKDISEKFGIEDMVVETEKFEEMAQKHKPRLN